MDYMQGMHDLLSRISSADIIVIGGSYAGLMATYEASRRGFKTILIKKSLVFRHIFIVVVFGVMLLFLRIYMIY